MLVLSTLRAAFRDLTRDLDPKFITTQYKKKKKRKGKNNVQQNSVYWMFKKRKHCKCLNTRVDIDTHPCYK